MGQGQADVALQMLRECSINGDWLCLKNLHLVTGENYTVIILTCQWAYNLYMYIYTDFSVTNT